MKLYAIRNYDAGVSTGYFIGPHGPVIFGKKIDADNEAARLNAMPHAANRVYRAEPIQN